MIYMISVGDYDYNDYDDDDDDDDDDDNNILMMMIIDWYN